MEFRKLFRGGIGLLILAMVWANPVAAFSFFRGHGGHASGGHGSGGGSGSGSGTPPASGVVAGSYVNANITVNSAGIITAASSGSLPNPSPSSGNTVLDEDGHLRFDESAPTAECSGCGAGGPCPAPTIEGSDNAGILRSMDPEATACVIKFSHPYKKSPSCIISATRPGGIFGTIVWGNSLGIFPEAGTAFSPNMAVHYHCTALE